ncbi:MAG TPA: DUF3999 family protein, partial [Vicinamibacteria bacterium]|nr:DUF3999 family protein [Vicinamibacteria bacterium]
DRDVYERARRDLGDLRVFDEAGDQVPYLLETAGEDPFPETRRPRLLNRTFLRGRSSSVTLDFGGPVLKSELTLELSGHNFRRRVTVEGRNRHDREWEALTDGGYVFALPAPHAARYETVALPENNFQFLKVTVHAGPDDQDPIEIRQAWTRPQERRRPREQEVPLSLRVVEDARAHETQLLVDLGARHQPFRGLRLDVADGRFFRGVTVEARSDPAHPADAPYWRPLAEATVYRYQEAGRAHEQLRIDVCGRERQLRLRIHNRDDRPLQLRAAALLVPIERLVFDAEPGRAYALTYGSEALDAPVYDVARTVRDPALWVAQASEGRLGPPAHRPAAAALAPWTERHPRLVWAGLGVLVLLLGTILGGYMLWTAWRRKLRSAQLGGEL